MTSDLDATTDDLYDTIRALWQQSQGGAVGADADLSAPAGYGQSVSVVKDTDIAAASGLDLEPVREFLDNADGTRLVVSREGDSRSVTGLLGS